MSVRAVSWAYGLNLGSMTQKTVLLYLAKVWTLRLDASTESFNGVERAEDVQTAYTGRSVRS